VKLAAGAFVLTVGVICAGQALADPRLDEKVYDPYVLNHVAEFEFRPSQVIGGPLGGARTTVLEAEYGLNDRVSLALVGAIGRDPGESSRFHDLGLEGVVYLGRIPRLGVDAGLYLELSHGLNGESDFAEAKLLLAKREGRFEGLFNFIIERPLGVPAGEGFASYGYAASATWRTVGKLQVGAEAFGDLGDDHGFLRGPQGAYVGPKLKWEGHPTASSPLEIEVGASWLKSVGADRAEADSQFRLVLELERRF